MDLSSIRFLLQHTNYKYIPFVTEKINQKTTITADSLLTSDLGSSNFFTAIVTANTDLQETDINITQPNIEGISYLAAQKSKQDIKVLLTDLIHRNKMRSNIIVFLLAAGLILSPGIIIHRHTRYSTRTKLSKICQARYMIVGICIVFAIGASFGIKETGYFFQEPHLALHYITNPGDSFCTLHTQQETALLHLAYYQQTILLGLQYDLKKSLATLEVAQQAEASYQQHGLLFYDIFSSLETNKTYIKSLLNATAFLENYPIPPKQVICDPNFNE